MRKGIKMGNEKTIKKPRVFGVSVVAENIILLTCRRVPLKAVCRLPMSHSPVRPLKWIGIFPN
jgi:hypothetical protein